VRYASPAHPHGEYYAGPVVTGTKPDTLAAARSELPNDVTVVQADARSLADTERCRAGPLAVSAL